MVTMYNVVSVKHGISQVQCCAYRGVCNSTGNTAWLCSEDAFALERVLSLLQASKLENPESVVLLDEFLNRNASVVLVSPSDGLGNASRMENGGLLLESRGRKFAVFKGREKYAGVLYGL